MILHNTHVNFLASTLLALYTYFTLILAYFLFSTKLSESLSRFINNVLQTNESLANESNFPSSSLFVYYFLVISWENVQTISV